MLVLWCTRYSPPDRYLDCLARLFPLSYRPSAVLFRSRYSSSFTQFEHILFSILLRKLPLQALDVYSLKEQSAPRFVEDAFR